MDIIDEFKKIIKKNDIDTVFQPIVSLKNAKIIGYEAFSRGPKDSHFHLPMELFSMAKKCNNLWALESLCLKKAIENFKPISDDHLLFLNINSSSISEHTNNLLGNEGKSNPSIIYEISKCSTIENYADFSSVLKNFINQKYKIALLDKVACNCMINMLSEVKPSFIKLDMELVRNINTSSLKQALVKALITLSENTNINLIAEGIETEDELKMLINLGIYAGQGYFIQKPSKKFNKLDNCVKQIILEHSNMLKDSLNSNKNHIGLIVSKEPAFSSTTSCAELKSYFSSSSSTGASIVKDDKPVGLVMQHSLDSVLATQYGNAVFSRRQVSLVMDATALIVDFYTSLHEVSQKAMSRENNKLYDNIIVTKDDKYYGIVTVKNMLDYTTLLEKNYARELNPLTGLPGNTTINSMLNELLTTKKACCVLYFDLDNFKVYNDTYGFENGDKILKFTAELIQSEVKSYFKNNSFVGHIGGDDFVSVIEAPLPNCTELCSDITKNFDEKIMDFFNEEDRNNGFIVSHDRKGNKDTFPLTSISIASLHGNFCKYQNAEEISKHISKIKTKVKKKCLSNFLIEATDN